MAKLVLNDVPDYIKQWYKNEAEKRGQKMTPYSTLILVEHALANGADEQGKKNKCEQ